MVAFFERKVDVGSHVRAGDVLARLNDTEQQADVRVARAALESAQSRCQTKDIGSRAIKVAPTVTGSSARQIFDDAQKELLSAAGFL